MLYVVHEGERQPLDSKKLESMVAACCHGLGDHVSVKPIVQETLRNVYDGIALEDVCKASILSAPTLIEKDFGYSYVTARLLLHTIAREVLGGEFSLDAMGYATREAFPLLLHEGVQADLLNESLLQFDLPHLAAAL